MIRVAAAVVMHGGKVLLARRKAGEAHAGLWEFPGGKIEGSETPGQCLERELHEELGLLVNAGRVLAETEDRADHGEFTIIAVEAVLLGGRLKLTVHDDVQWVCLDDIDIAHLAPADRDLVKKIRKDNCRSRPI